MAEENKNEFSEEHKATLFKIVKMKADSGEVSAYPFLAEYYATGFGCEPDMKQATTWWMLGAQAGEPCCQYNMGILFLNMAKNDEDFKTAYDYIEAACKQNYKEAFYTMGGFYLTGTHVQKDLKKAYDYYLKSANLGFSEAQYMLACLLTKGEGVEKNLESAWEWFNKAAAQGHQKAIETINNCQSANESINKKEVLDDPNCAAAVIQMADAGDVEMQFKVGMIYEGGHGVEVDFKKALEYYTKAADNGHKLANYKIGFMYVRGRINLKEDYVNGVKYFTLASDKGVEEATLALAIIYMTGYKVDEDIVKGTKLLKKISKTNKTAKELLDIYDSQDDTEAMKKEFTKYLNVIVRGKNSDDIQTDEKISFKTEEELSPLTKKKKTASKTMMDTSEEASNQIYTIDFDVKAYKQGIANKKNVISVTEKLVEKDLLTNYPHLFNLCMYSIFRFTNYSEYEPQKVVEKLKSLENKLEGENKKKLQEQIFSAKAFEIFYSNIKLKDYAKIHEELDNLQDPVPIDYEFPELYGTYYAYASENLNLQDDYQYRYNAMLEKPVEIVTFGYYLYALKCFNQDKLDEAMELLLKMKTDDPLYPVILCLMAKIYYKKGDIEKSFQYHMASIYLGYGESASEIADCYMEGKYVKQDITKALSYYNMALDNGYLPAGEKLANYYLSINNLEMALFFYIERDTYKDHRVNHKKIIELMEIIYPNGYPINGLNRTDIAFYSPNSEYLLALLGSGQPKNYFEELDWWGDCVKLNADEAIAKGELKAHLLLGAIEQDEKKSMEHFKIAADNGCAASKYILAINYMYDEDNNHNIKPTYKQGIELLKEAAEDGDVDALSHMGYLYYNGEGVKKSKTKAIEYFTKAANKNNPSALYQLATLMDAGEIPVSDKTIIKNLHFRAMMVGNIDSIKYLAEIYKNEDEVIKEAYEKFDENDIDSCFDLANVLIFKYSSSYDVILSLVKHYCYKGSNFAKLIMSSFIIDIIKDTDLRLYMPRSLIKDCLEYRKELLKKSMSVEDVNKINQINQKLKELYEN